MSSVRLASSLVCALAVSACSRPSEPPPGPGAAKPLAALSGSAEALLAAPSAPHRSSVHDRDMPGSPPPRPPSDNATSIKASHILIAYRGALDAPPSVTRDSAAAKKLAQMVGMEAHAGGNFADLVTKYSDDAKTRANDGRLGQISRTQMAKPFTDAAFDLMVKEITIDPVETAVGFHIIKRTE
ncbi:MAG TPA: peptidylprolyl isomerase [Polyangiaceae bacterium]|nr:peptidylprolyl isomerase [Polyangiaceae bacterium]